MTNLEPRSSDTALTFGVDSGGASAGASADGGHGGRGGVGGNQGRTPSAMRCRMAPRLTAKWTSEKAHESTKVERASTSEYTGPETEISRSSADEKASMSQGDTASHAERKHAPYD